MYVLYVWCPPPYLWTYTHTAYMGGSVHPQAARVQLLYVWHTHAYATRRVEKGQTPNHLGVEIKKIIFYDETWRLLFNNGPATTTVVVIEWCSKLVEASAGAYYL